MNLENLSFLKELKNLNAVDLDFSDNNLQTKDFFYILQIIKEMENLKSLNLNLNKNVIGEEEV